MVSSETTDKLATRQAPCGSEADSTVVLYDGLPENKAHNKYSLLENCNNMKVTIFCAKLKHIPCRIMQNFSHLLMTYSTSYFSCVSETIKHSPTASYKRFINIYGHDRVVILHITGSYLTGK